MTVADVITAFNEVFNAHDVDAVVALMTEDVVFESTSPFPDGTRYVGREANRAFWTEFFAGSPQAHFETEEMFATDDRCVVRWLYRWQDADGAPGHIRGVDVFTVRDGLVAAKLAYVKG